MIELTKILNMADYPHYVAFVSDCASLWACGGQGS